MQFVEANLANNGQKLTKFSINYKSQIPQEMENALVKKGLKETEIPFYTYLGFRFSFAYEKDCVVVEKKYSCKDQSDEKRKEIRGKYLQYFSEMLELHEQYSQEKFGEILPQILSFPADTFSHDSADEVVQILKNKGYEFISLDEASASEKSNNLYKISRENIDFFTKQREIENKYSDRLFPISDKSMEESLKKAEENLKKNFNVNITTKDLKPKPQ